MNLTLVATVASIFIVAISAYLIFVFLPRRYDIRGQIIGFIVCCIILIIVMDSFINVATSLSFTCSGDPITVDGSTALFPLVDKIAQDYNSNICGGKSLITAKEVSSITGLEHVENGTIAIADSDVPPPPSDGDLVDHPVASVIFTIVIDPHITSVKNLSTNDLRQIYTGKITNWRDVGGPKLPIDIVSRPADSGTRTTFDMHVLCTTETIKNPSERETNEAVAQHVVLGGGGSIGYVDLGTAMKYSLQPVSIDGIQPNEDNILAGKYHFWNIEHMYTKGIPKFNSLTESFLRYVNQVVTDGSVPKSLNYIPFNDLARKFPTPNPCPST